MTNIWGRAELFCSIQGAPHPQGQIYQLEFFFSTPASVIKRSALAGIVTLVQPVLVPEDQTVCRPGQISPVPPPPAPFWPGSLQSSHTCKLATVSDELNKQESGMRKTPINTNELKFKSQDGKTSPCRLIILPSRRRTPGATKIVGKFFFSISDLQKEHFFNVTASATNNQCCSFRYQQSVLRRRWYKNLLRSRQS